MQMSSKLKILFQFLIINLLLRCECCVMKNEVDEIFSKEYIHAQEIRVKKFYKFQVFVLNELREKRNLIVVNFTFIMVICICFQKLKQNNRNKILFWQKLIFWILYRCTLCFEYITRELTFVFLFKLFSLPGLDGPISFHLFN